MNNESTKSTLLYVLTNTSKLLHPFMLFVNEEYSKVTIESNTNELNVKLTYYYEVSEEENRKR